MSELHTSVLLSEVEIAFCSLSRHRVVVDATLGLAGHARMMRSHMDVSDVLLGFDRDRENLERAQKSFGSIPGDTRYIHASFEDLADVCEKEGI